MKQRLGIAGALLGDPEILLFDEPVNGLDPEGILWIRTFMQSLAAQGRTVFVSSHLLSEMAVTAGHLLVIGKGELLADAATEDFISRATTVLGAGAFATAGRSGRRAATRPGWPSPRPRTPWWYRCADRTDR